MKTHRPVSVSEPLPAPAKSRVFENKILRLKETKLQKNREKLHNAELHALHCSTNIIRNLKFYTTEMGLDM